MALTMSTNIPPMRLMASPFLTLVREAGLFRIVKGRLGAFHETLDPIFLTC